ncbi:PREDICTED: uncharacterized protein LOC102107517 [Pseudopodoces humilis]|uniref:uncharacterized protein LOC102107517 n=1 Tax=Pseudopodoces humilis TaxID=181119 RepID=UPI000395DBFB|nr:PREDICTED: uncharacterized protein LOC102107517 [Pseudopodoces humilis]
MSPPPEGDIGVALAQVLLCVTSLGCAIRARRVTGGPAAGFLLQALAAATDAVSLLCPSVPSDVPTSDVPSDVPFDVPSDVPTPPPPSWICTLLAQPLVAFGCHRLGGDGATAALLLSSLSVVAAVTAALAAEARGLAGRWAVALTAGSLLALAALSGCAPAGLAAALVALGDTELVAPWGVPWVRAAASVALLRALGWLREQGQQ